MINFELIKKNNVELVAASKTRTIEEIKKLNETGAVSAFGENRVQEMLSKYDPKFVWDFIGRLQTNKVKYIIDKVRLIQSVDRINLLEEINKQAEKIGKVQKILIEINSGNEENKGGLAVEDAENFAKIVQNYKNVELLGIMAVAPFDIADNELKVLFTNVKDVYNNIKKTYKTVKYLSMGMSDDHELAIECGSNMVRIGTALFSSKRI